MRGADLLATPTAKRTNERRKRFLKTCISKGSLQLKMNWTESTRQMPKGGTKKEKTIYFLNFGIRSTTRRVFAYAGLLAQPY
ncbi:hypothetical protein NDU88_001276 [Pleurodeles waltl]|uniref:Uncharacterized protein n=1 Tax=Pleurodeles waltl TaxID=8319 RepID=A0AAV7TIP8_PLEWA|nr:hypothetical protein NDU88_001276 [Pleurodeles waltl]